MNRRLATCLTAGLCALAALLLCGLYGAARHVPGYYAEVLDVPREAHRQSSDRLLENAAALAGNVRKPGDWRAMFTANEINGWLAADLMKMLPGVLPAGVIEPRVRLKPGCVCVACRYVDAALESVVSLEADVYVKQPNVLSLRLRRARLGALPLPMGKLIEGLTAAAREADLRLSWMQADGDPVAILRLHSPHDSAGTAYSLETLEVGEGELFIAGHTSYPSLPSDGTQSPDGAPAGPLASSADEKEKLQR
jgi:hypothetical protein